MCLPQTFYEAEEGEGGMSMRFGVKIVGRAGRVGRKGGARY